MAEQVETKSVREALVPQTIEEATFAEIDRTVFASAKQIDEMRHILRAWEADDFGAAYRNKTEAALIRGYLHYINGEIERAEELFKAARTEPWGAYWLARVALDMNRAEGALDLIEKARERFPDFGPLSWLKAEALIKAGKIPEAQAALEALPPEGRDTSRHCYLRGRLAERSGNYEEALDLYRKAVDLDARNGTALFQLGKLSSVYGDIDEAVSCYEACSRLTPVNVNALVNLGVMYEDLEQYQDAVRCYRSILAFYPNHPRAKLFLNDALASTSMFYDREREKEVARQNQILKIPVSDFELSVRSRNCLSKMNIETLGDLIMKTEPELLSYKNFGETSLMEVKAILGQKSLHLGQGIEQRRAEEKPEVEEIDAGVDPEVLNRPVETLNLSIRSRRCMERLKVRTIRDLIHKGEVELMAAKNFGVTSLNEVKEKLETLGLKLRG